MEEIWEDEQSLTQQPFKLKEVGCQNSMVRISNSRLQTIWEEVREEGGGRCHICDLAGVLCSRSDLWLIPGDLKIFPRISSLTTAQCTALPLINQ